MNRVTSNRQYDRKNTKVTKKIVVRNKKTSRTRINRKTRIGSTINRNKNVGYMNKNTRNRSEKVFMPKLRKRQTSKSTHSNRQKSKLVSLKSQKFVAAVLIIICSIFIMNKHDISAFFTDMNSISNVFSIIAHYTIEFDANTGTGTMQDQEISYNVATAINANGFTKTGYMFAGWNTKADGSGTSYVNGQQVTNIGNKTLYAQWEKVKTKYAVQIYGINQDEDESGNLLGLTFGPALGEYYGNKYVTHRYQETSSGSGVYNVVIVTHTVASDWTETITEVNLKNSSGNNVTRTEVEKNKYDVNLHTMTWEQIANTTDKTKFLDCMLCGDTKSVKLDLNSYLGPTNPEVLYGDGLGIIYSPIEAYFRRWNPNQSQNSAAVNGGNYGSNGMYEEGYASSHIRASLIGENSKTNVDYAGNANLPENLSIYSCIDNDLRNIIVPKKVKYLSEVVDPTHYTVKTLSDKIWLFSEAEMYARSNYTGQNAEGIGANGDGYQRFGNTESKYYMPSYSFAAVDLRKGYYAEDTVGAMWLRSPTMTGERFIRAVYYTGNIGDGSAYTAYGLGFGFCLQGNYQITFNSNGGTGTMGNQTISNNVSTRLLANTFTKTNCAFMGWNTEADGSGTSYTDRQEVTNLGNITLYAQWGEGQAFFEGDNSSSYLENVEELENITSFQKFSGATSDVQTLINNGTAVRIDDNTTSYKIYAWSDNGDIYWWTDAAKAYMLDKSHYLLSDLPYATSIDVTGIDTSRVTDMNSMFINTGMESDTFELIGIENMDTSNVEDMNTMFSNTGYCAEEFELDLSNWDTSSVEDMSHIFEYTGYCADTFEIDLTNWDTSNVTNMNSMFAEAGTESTEFEIIGIEDLKTSSAEDMGSMFYGLGYSLDTLELDLSGYDTSNALDMSYMFSCVGYNAEICDLGDLTGWNTSSVENMESMFNYTGYSATNFELDLTGWDTSNVFNMNSMFNEVGYNSNTLNIIGISGWNTECVEDMAEMFSRAGMNATTWSIGDLSGWKTGSVQDMNYMFSYAGHRATTWDIGDLDDWDTSNVTDMNHMFDLAGYYTTGTWSLGDISGWDVSSVKSMNSMFFSAGDFATIWDVGDLSNWETTSLEDANSAFFYAIHSGSSWTLGDFSGWDTANVKDMKNMFSCAGDSGDISNFEIDVSGWNTSSVKDMSGMFEHAGRNASIWSIGDLSEWNTEKVEDMSRMFHNTGGTDSTWDIGDLYRWDTHNVKSMKSMFDQAGELSTNFELDLTNWNTSQVTDMNSMFSYSGLHSTVWSIGDLTNWNTSQVTDMRAMFFNAGHDATTWDSIGTLKIYATDILSMFNDCKNASAVLNFYTIPTTYSLTFIDASTVSGSGIIVNYKSTVTNIDNIIATKSNDSNVVKGSIIP